jgi:uncharacterized damage-inducible protein DinB
VLLAYLHRQRELVHWKCEGLSDDAARAVATPSGLTIHGIVRHLENVERWWWRWRFAGQHDLRFDWTDEDPDAELHVPDDVHLADLLVAYRAETAACDGVVAAHGLDDVGARSEHTLRWVLLHLIEETSRHLGHLDLLCELADGRTGEEPRPGSEA